MVVVRYDPSDTTSATFDHSMFGGDSQPTSHSMDASEFPHPIGTSSWQSPASGMDEGIDPSLLDLRSYPGYHFPEAEKK
jgi:hypothetical protein